MNSLKFEFRFKEHLRDDILTGKFNKVLIKKGLIPDSKQNSPLTNQDVIDIVKKQTGKDKGSKQSVTDWLDGTLPKIEVISALADACDVTVDWLIGKSTAQSIEEEEGYRPFERLGLSLEAYQALKKIANKHLHDDSLNVIETLNTILEDYDEDCDTVNFNTLNAISRYLDIGNRPFYRLNENTMKFIEQLEKNEFNNVTVGMLTDIFKSSATLSTIEEMDSDAFFYLKSAFKILKRKLIKKEIDTIDAHNTTQDKIFKNYQDTPEDSRENESLKRLKEIYDFYSK